MSEQKRTTAGGRCSRAEPDRKDIKPLDIMTREAFENAITVVIALGGSTNAVLHLLAMAREAGVPLTLDDFTRSVPSPGAGRRETQRQVPDVGTDRDRRHSAADEDAARRGLLHGDCMTVTGKTLAENLADVATIPRTGHRSRLRQSDQAGQPPGDSVWQPGPEGAVAKISGKEGLRFAGTARVFHSEEDALQAILDDDVRAATSSSFATRDRKAARDAGDAEPDRGHHGQGSRRRGRADHRRPLLGRQPRICRRSRFAGSRCWRSDRPHRRRRCIEIDAQQQQINVEVDAEEMRRRRAAWNRPARRYAVESLPNTAPRFLRHPKVPSRFRPPGMHDWPRLDLCDRFAVLSNAIFRHPRKVPDVSPLRMRKNT